ncbi:aminodeoxychorismate synthase component I [Plebeiibacterium sediminum]|uniref:Aminodeoxychorismate synthase component I n=1 Tax=Plebeiibacterium sediminum TaxID=2992112 RepID=A0AAE3SFB5_9BACT|nr:aminodeoxychorismate synthase component I [Plebeiobacterium sediminum]MCW3787258.1 aminodeoxychorismate synthase component I [Plebeiobacterium sediminum]
MRRKYTIHIDDEPLFKQKLLAYCKNMDYCGVYDSCGYNGHGHDGVNYYSYDFLAGIGSVEAQDGSFEALNNLQRKTDWLFGYLGYDLKNELEHLYSVNYDQLYFSPTMFFQPRYVLIKRDAQWNIEYLEELDNEQSVDLFLKEINDSDTYSKSTETLTFSPKISREKYIDTVNSILEHIHKGDIYEINYCQEFCAEQVDIDPYDTYLRLIEISPTPFASFLKVKDKYVISASPERYMKKEGQTLISQPIKGTAPRGKTTVEDEKNAFDLQNCAKERSENIMIADLVRNDLSRVAKMGSVQVEELCGIYAFPQVFQMITTVVADLDDEKDAIEAIKYSFPMGSMTGAPKIRAMKLIEKYEDTKRGVYSGSVGYFTPSGDFDFNVVIRSLLYNSSNNYLSFMVGSAITAKSVPESEYEECLVKASAIFKLFNS